MTTQVDVLIIGGGPAGAAAGYWLAKAGHDVLIVEKKEFPRAKTCGDGLTPRAVKQLQDMGLGQDLEIFHRYDGLRSIAHGISLELKWPEHPTLPNFGYVAPRADLDNLAANNAIKAGCAIWFKTEAKVPIFDGKTLKGVKVNRQGRDRIVSAKYVVVADGSNSRFGRALGTSRDKSRPVGLALRTYYESPLHDDPWIESHLELKDEHGNYMPGYGWIFPVGDGTVNVGVGVLSSFKWWKQVNTTKVLETFVAGAPERWGLSPKGQTCPPTGGKLPTGFSINPQVGPNWLVVGDAGGSINPFNGEGISYAYETGRIAAGYIHNAISENDPLQIFHYPAELEDTYGQYFKVARAFVAAIGKPVLMREFTRIGMRSESLMRWTLRVMSNMMRTDNPGKTEKVYEAIAKLVSLGPQP